MIDTKHFPLDGPTLYWPLASRYFFNGGYTTWTPNDLIQADVRQGLEARSGIAFLHKACDKGFYKSHAATRVALFDLLGHNATALGHCRGKNRKGSSRSEWLEESIALYKGFKFVITFENSFRKGYWTEKLITAVLAGSIPIYGGFGETPAIAMYVNPRRFIYCQFDPESFHDKDGFDTNDPEKRIRAVKERQRTRLEDCIETIRRVDQNDTLYQSIVKAPFLYNNTVEDSIFDLNRIGSNIRHLLRDHGSYLVNENHRS